MTQPFPGLAADHALLLDLCNQLTGGAGEPSGSPTERKHIAERLVIEASKHEAVEEEFFWPLVSRRLEGGDNLALAGQEQEAGAKRLLNELDHVSSGTEDFHTLVTYIASVVRDHVTLEESQVWPKLVLAVSEDELHGVDAKMAAAKATAPTRPHPHTPAMAGVQKTIGAVAAMMDRARDAITGRGR